MTSCASANDVGNDIFQAHSANNGNNSKGSMSGA
jgi:hypothetical protein